MRNTEWHQHELIALALAERHKLRAERAESELTRLRAQEPVAWQWIQSGHFRKNRPPAAEHFDWRPLYADPMPAKESK